MFSKLSFAAHSVRLLNVNIFFPLQMVGRDDRIDRDRDLFDYSKRRVLFLPMQPLRIFFVCFCFRRIFLFKIEIDSTDTHRQRHQPLDRTERRFRFRHRYGGLVDDARARLPGRHTSYGCLR